MNFFQKRQAAWLITLAVIALATLGGGRSSLMELRDEAEVVFYAGDFGNGMGIQYDLDQIAAQALNLTVVAGRYLEQNNSAILRVKESAEVLQAAKGPGEKYDAAQELVAGVIDLSDQLQGRSLGEQDETYRRRILVNIESSQKKIGSNSYNTKAKEFNETLSQFPTNVLSGVTLVAPLELYE